MVHTLAVTSPVEELYKCRSFDLVNFLLFALNRSLCLSLSVNEGVFLGCKADVKAHTAMSER